MNNKPNAISLFSGIGGLDIGFSKAGYNIIAQIEIDKFCQCVLKRHKKEWWPNATAFADVRKFGRGDFAGEIEIIFGGFPCQPHSVAGKKLGEADDRDLWPDFRRIISEFRPRTVLLENVPGILTGYATIVIADLTALGYDCRWGTIQAADTGAPHKRERWFCVAYDNGQRKLQQKRVVGNVRRRTSHVHSKMAYSKSEGCTTGGVRGRDAKRQPTTANKGKILGNPEGARLSKRRHIATKNKRSNCLSEAIRVNNRFDRYGHTSDSRTIRKRLAQPGMDRTNDGIPAWLDKPRWPAGQGIYQHKWEAPRTIGKGINPHRASRIKALGNSVIPQIAYALACEIRGLS